MGKPPPVSKGTGGFLKFGGAFRTHLELPKLLSQDIMIIAKKFVELGFSLRWIKTMLNEQPQKKDHLIL